MWKINYDCKICKMIIVIVELLWIQFSGINY
jgi:hypothetical protein